MRDAGASHRGGFFFVISERPNSANLGDGVTLDRQTQNPAQLGGIGQYPLDTVWRCPHGPARDGGRASSQQTASHDSDGQDCSAHLVMVVRGPLRRGGAFVAGRSGRPLYRLSALAMHRSDWRANVAHADEQLSYKMSYTRVMADTITFRPDEDTSKALEVLTKDGTPVSAVVRTALIDAARRKASAAIRAEAETLAEDESDRAEAMQVLRDMETLRAW
jgi:hypothetical protein